MNGFERLAWRLALAVAVAMGFAPAAPARADVQRIDRALFLMSDSATPPPPQDAWEPVTLPDAWAKARPKALGTAWYRITFDGPADARDPWMVYLTRLRDGGEIWLNGALMSRVRQSDTRYYVRWMRPFAFLLPPHDLRPGANTIDIRVVASASDAAMAPVHVGPEDEVESRYDRRHWWSYSSTQLTAGMTIVVGALVIAIWLRRRLAFDYGLFGLAAVFWGIRTLSFVIEVYPVGLWHPWRIVHYAATGGFVVTMALFMLRFAGLRRPAIERAMIAFWPTGPLVLMFGGAEWRDAVDRYYQAGLVLVSVVTFCAALYAVWRQRTAGALALGGGVIFSLVLGVHDYLLSQRVLDYERPYLLHLGADLLLIIVGILLADRFVQSLAAAERAGELLEATVRAREAELAANFARLRASENERVALEERQRIMQDMHDGLGSQLLSSLAMVERGALDRQGMAQVLREAIDDMRLAIDTLSPGREGLPEALGNLFYRLEPRFRAAAIALHFDPTTLPERIDMPPDRALQVLRIVQEALNNVLKHAQASRVAVRATVTTPPRRLELEVADDGRGFDVSSPNGGRGITGMRRRAERIGARLEVTSGLDGTRVVLSYPLAGNPP